MPIVNRIAAFDEDMKKWRRNIHQNPELGLDCHETASFIEARLREFGIDEIHTGIAKSGLVAIIDGKDDGDTIGLRADIDALPMGSASISARRPIVSPSSFPSIMATNPDFAIPV